MTLNMFSTTTLCMHNLNWRQCLLYLQLRQSLDALLNDMKNLPARLKQYSSFEYVQKTIKTYLKVIMKLFMSPLLKKYIVFSTTISLDFNTLPYSNAVQFCSRTLFYMTWCTFDSNTFLCVFDRLTC